MSMTTFHRITSGNVRLLDQVAPDVFDDVIDPHRVVAYAAQASHLLIVALDADRVVGQVAAYVHAHPDQPSDLYIDNLGVTPAMRRQGIARRLVNEIREWGAALGCAQAWIVTDTDNLEARQLYASSGAEAVEIVMYSYPLGNAPQPRDS